MNVNNYLSDHNLAILNKQGEKILKKHLNFCFQEQKPSWFSTILSYLPFPSFYSIGRTVGWAGAVTHGPELTNYTIEKLAPVVLKQSGNKFGSAVLTEAVKLTANPYLLPIVTNLCTSGGGLCLQGAAVLVGWIFHRVLSNKNTAYTLKNLPDLDQLIKVDQKGMLIDANGEEISIEDIRQISKWASRYNLIYRLIGAERQNVPHILEDYIKIEGAKICYLNGEEISEKHQKIFKIARDCLSANNITSSEKEIKKTIRMLTENAFNEVAHAPQNIQLAERPQTLVEVVSDDDEDLSDWCMIPSPLKAEKYDSQVFFNSIYKEALSQYCFKDDSESSEALVKAFDSFYRDISRNDGVETFFNSLQHYQEKEENSEFKQLVNRILNTKNDAEFIELLRAAHIDEEFIQRLLPLPRMKTIEFMVIMSQRTIALYQEKLQEKMKHHRLQPLSQQDIIYEISEDCNTIICRRIGVRVCPLDEQDAVIGEIVGTLDHIITLNISKTIQESPSKEEISNVQML